MDNKRHNISHYVVPESVNDSGDISDPNAGTATVDYHRFGQVYMFGEKTSGFKITGPPQNFSKLREYHTHNRILFQDENFPANDIELANVEGEVVWKRPHEIVKDPQFIIDGVSRFDINQGELGDCWFLAAVSAVTTNQTIFSFVVPDDQDFTKNYAGIFHFRFWQFGRWVDVVIDDLLPTINNRLVYLHSSDPREFWPSLLEKAYAKFYGSYKNIDGGEITEGLEDLCGGISENYKVQNQRDLFEIMYMSHNRSSFMGCDIKVKDADAADRPDGLVAWHAYSVTDIQIIKVGTTEKKLISLRNPWGNNTEWNGNWSDHSKCWDLVSVDQRNKLRYQKADGEFWMEFSDFQRCFTEVGICHLNPSFFNSTKNDNTNWNVFMFENAWIPNVTAGGGLLYKDSTFSCNPQYHLTIRGNSSTSKYTVLINLMPKDRRAAGQQDLPLELAIYKVDSGAGKILDKSFFVKEKPLYHCNKHERNLTVRILLSVGKYCIIPTTWHPNVYARYLLRIYSEDNANIVENDVEIGYSSDPIKHHKFKEGEDPVSNLFKNIAQDKKEIGWREVQELINILLTRAFGGIKPKIPFSKEACEYIVALWDVNFSGRLDYEESERLMKDIAALNEKFQQFDKDHSKKLDDIEFKGLLAACGFRINTEILEILMSRYGENGAMNFENFVVCAITLKKIMDTLDATKNISVSRKDWLKTQLSKLGGSK